MAYSEYFDNACVDAPIYSNYVDSAEYTCAIYYTCAVSHENYYVGFSCTSYSNHSNSYHNHSNVYHAYCVTTYGYNNHFNYTNPTTANYDPGAFDSAWSGTALTSTYITESVDAIKDLRNKIKLIANNKGQSTIIPTNVESASGITANTEFDGVGHDYVENEHYNALRSTMAELWTDLNVSGSFSSADLNDNDEIKRDDWNTLKGDVDDVISCSVSYSNSVNYNETITPVSGHNNYCETS